MKQQLNKVRHDYLRYANCWEDADVLLKGLDIHTGDRVFSIGSGGDNSFSLLAGNPELVVVVDINEVQLKLIELKKAAFMALNYDEFLEFLGFRLSSRRKELFTVVSKELTLDTLDYWFDHFQLIQDGIIFQGKFEKYFNGFKHKILPLIHHQKNIYRLFEAKSPVEQRKFYDKKWNNVRWKFLFKIFFSRFVLGRFGRDPKFLNEVKIPVSTFILNQAGKHLESMNCQKNYFLEFILKGKFECGLPHYARKENYDRIKKNLDKLVIFKGFAEDVFKVHTKFNKFNLSNIFEYMPHDLFTEITTSLVENGTKNSRYFYWNLMVNRTMSSVHSDLEHQSVESENLNKEDLGFFYLSTKLDIKL